MTYSLRNFLQRIDPWSILVACIILCGVAIVRSGVMQRPSLRQGEAGLRAAALNVIRPAFPPELTQSSDTGVAVAQVRLAPSGIPSNVEILESPHPAISRSMETALAGWRFPPVWIPESYLAARVRGKITYYFSIEDGVGVVRTPDEQAVLRQSAVQRRP